MYATGGLGELLGGYFRRRMPLFSGLVFLFVLGVVFGTLSVHTLSEPQKEDLASYLDNFFTSLTQEELRNMDAQLLARRGMTDNIVRTAGLSWVLGLTIIGVPFILGIVFLRGFILGFTVGFLIDEMVLRGVLLSVVSILPHNLLVVPAVILSAGASVSFSITALKTLFGAKRENVYHQFIGYTLFVLLSCGLLAAAAFVEAYVTPIFIVAVQQALS